jgi:hypothetical protein
MKMNLIGNKSLDDRVYPALAGRQTACASLT